MASYFPDQKSLVTVLRYRVVIEEILVTLKIFLSLINRQKKMMTQSQRTMPLRLKTISLRIGAGDQ